MGGWPRVLAGMAPRSPDPGRGGGGVQHEKVPQTVPTPVLAPGRCPQGDALGRRGVLTTSTGPHQDKSQVKRAESLWGLLSRRHPWPGQLLGSGGRVSTGPWRQLPPQQASWPVLLSDRREDWVSPPSTEATLTMAGPELMGGTAAPLHGVKGAPPRSPPPSPLPGPGSPRLCQENQLPSLLWNLRVLGEAEGVCVSQSTAQWACVWRGHVSARARDRSMAVFRGRQGCPEAGRGLGLLPFIGFHIPEAAGLLSLSWLGRLAGQAARPVGLPRVSSFQPPWV